VPPTYVPSHVARFSCSLQCHGSVLVLKCAVQPGLVLVVALCECLTCNFLTVGCNFLNGLVLTVQSGSCNSKSGIHN